MTSLAAEGVSVRRAGRLILDRVDVAASPGEVTALVGPSGSGKSTLLALLAGLEAPDAGRVRSVNGARVGLVLQAYGLVGLLTAAENVELVLQVEGRLRPAEIRRRAAAMLDAVGLTAVVDSLVEELSTGQQQRVAVARALVGEPTVLLADEFTAALDAPNRALIVDLVLGVAARGGIVVIATHDPAVAARASRIIRLESGRVAE